MIQQGDNKPVFRIKAYRLHNSILTDFRCKTGYCMQAGDGFIVCSFSRSNTAISITPQIAAVELLSHRIFREASGALGRPAREQVDGTK